METAAPLSSQLRHPLARRRAQHLARTRQAHNQILAWRVQDSLVELGLTHLDHSILAGGWCTFRRWSRCPPDLRWD